MRMRMRMRMLLLLMVRLCGRRVTLGRRHERILGRQLELKRKVEHVVRRTRTVVLRAHTQSSRELMGAENSEDLLAAKTALLVWGQRRQREST